MKIETLVRSSLSLVWERKALWLFGFFVAGSAGGVGGSFSPGGGAASGGGEPLPWWLAPVLAGALAIAIGSLVMHLLSEGALIDAVVKARAGQATPVRAELHEGARHAWRLLAIKAAAFSAMLVASAVVVLPIGAVLLAGGPVVVGAVGSAILALAMVPAMLTLYFLYMFAMRSAVLDGRGVVDATRAAYERLHGHLADAVRLLIADGIGSFAFGLVGAVAVVPAALVGLAVYLAAGSVIPAAVTAAVLIVPLAVAVTGARGMFRSSVWTLAWLEAGA